MNKHFGIPENELTVFQKEYTVLMDLCTSEKSSAGQKQLALIAGKDQASISRYKKRGSFPQKVAEECANAFGPRISFLRLMNIDAAHN